MLYKFDTKQIKNLESFLKRVEMTGDEALAYVEIISILRNPIKEEKPEEKGD